MSWRISRDGERPIDDVAGAIARVVSRTGLAKVQHQTIETLSKGYKRRVGLEQFLIAVWITLERRHGEEHAIGDARIEAVFRGVSELGIELHPEAGGARRFCEALEKAVDLAGSLTGEGDEVVINDVGLLERLLVGLGDRVPRGRLGLLGEGRGFEIAQGRLGPGRIHHCMRLIGVAERALAKMCARLVSREAFGKKLYEHSVWEERIADARIDIECSRLLTLKAADMMDKVGNKEARAEIAMIKVKAPNMALKVLDDAIQAHGGGGVTTDFGLAHHWANSRTLRFADGPDEVHRRAIARIELKKQARRDVAR